MAVNKQIVLRKSTGSFMKAADRSALSMIKIIN